jgi:ferritin-like metal-binding protein YciE
MPEPSSALRALAVAELQSLLRSEPHLARAFRVLAARAQAKPLRKLCREGVQYTNRRTQRVRSVLRALDAAERERPTQGLDGLIRDAVKTASTGSKSPARDAAILAAVERISHYGLSSYTTIDRYLRAEGLPGRRLIAASIKEKREAIAEEGEMARVKLISELRDAA